MRRFLSLLGFVASAGACRNSSEQDLTSRRRLFSRKNLWANLLWAVTLSSIALFCINCGSNSFSESEGLTGIVTQTGAIAVSVSPNPDTLLAGTGGVTFGATVTNDVNSDGVSWSYSMGGVACTPVSGCGTLSGNTTRSVTYTPPASVSSSITVLLIATSIASGSSMITGSSTITVNPAPIVSVSPNPDVLIAGSGGAPFTVTVMHDVNSAGVSWSYSMGGVACTPVSGCGTLSNSTTSSITYTPPASVSSAITVQLTATSIADMLVTGSSTITINPGSTTGTGTVPQFLYSTNNSGYGRITVHSVNATTGQLRFGGYTVLNAAGDSISNAVLNPAGTYLYAADLVTQGIYGFTVGSNGQLNPLTGNALTTAGSAAGHLAVVSVTSSGDTFLYYFGGGSLTVMPVNTNGSIGPIISTPLSEINGATQMVFDPPGAHAYFGTPSGVAGFSINSNGALTALNGGSPYAAGASGSAPVFVTIAPNGSYFYAADPNDGNVYSFTINGSGALAAVGTPQSAGSSPRSLAIDPQGKFLFTSTSTGPISTILPYVINSGESLTAELPVTSLGVAGLLTVDPSDNFLYVADQVGSQSNETGIQSFTIGANASLAASLAIGEPAVGSMAILGGNTPITYTPQFAYTANQGFSNISGFQVNATTGALTAATGSPFSHLGSQTIALAASPLNNFLFAANASGNPNTVSAFTITASGTSAGSLTAVTGSPFNASGFTNTGIAEDASGRFVYTTSEASNEISEFLVGPTGALTAISGSPFAPSGAAAFASPSAIANSPFGSTLFVTNQNTNTVAALAIGPSGALSNFLNSSPIASGGTGTPGPVAVAVDPSNRFVYVANSAAKNIAAFQFTDANTSTPTPASFTPISGGTSVFSLDPSTNTPTSIAIEPTGRFLYVISTTTTVTSSVTVYSINQTTGALVEVGSPVTVNIPVSTGSGPLTGAAVDPSGQFLYAVVNNDASSGFNSVVFEFTIDPVHGTLTLQPTTFPVGYGASAVAITGSVQ